MAYPDIFSRGERFGQDPASFARTHQYCLSNKRLSDRNRAAKWVCSDHTARQHDGLRRRTHRVVGARQGNHDGQSYGRNAGHGFHAQAGVARRRNFTKRRNSTTLRTGEIHKSGSVYEEVWSRLIEAEKKGDPEKKGHAVLVAIERAEDLSGQPLT